MTRTVASLSVVSRWKMTFPFCSTAHRPSMLILSRPNSSASVARLPLLCGMTIVKSYACITVLLCRAPYISQLALDSPCARCHTKCNRCEPRIVVRRRTRDDRDSPVAGGIGRDALGEIDGNRRRDDHTQRHRIDDGTLIRPCVLGADPEGQRFIEAGGEGGHDDLVKRECECEQRTRDQG